MDPELKAHREYLARTEKRDIAILIGIGVALAIIVNIFLRLLGAQ